MCTTWSTILPRVSDARRLCSRKLRPGHTPYAYLAVMSTTVSAPAVNSRCCTPISLLLNLYLVPYHLYITPVL